MEIHRIRPDASIIIITAYATVDTAIQAMKESAQEYIVKPCNPQEISMLVSRILKLKKLQSENAILRKKLARQYKHPRHHYKNPRMDEILALTQDVASLRSTVLIRGESGTGKELVARAVHFSGNRADKPFITVSCAALTGTLLESELFGYEKGAFTGADRAGEGKIRTGGWRHDFSGRDRRHFSQIASRSSARAAGAALLSCGWNPGGRSRCARHCGNQ